MEAVIVLIELILSTVWIVFGFSYGFWNNGRPGGGFLGVIFGIVILLIALIMGIRMLVKREFGKKIELKKMVFLPVFAGFVATSLVYLLGFIPVIILFMFGWLRFVSKYKWTKSILVSLIFTVCIYAIFVLWLRVPFPTGVF